MTKDTPATETPVAPTRDWKPIIKKTLIWGGVIIGTALVTYALTRDGSLEDGSCELEGSEDSAEAEIEA